jgi:hypothetical protein
VLVVTPFAYDPPRDVHAAFFTGYNHTELANRVQDLLTAAAWLREQDYRRVELVGCGRGGLWALLARALDPQITAAVCDMDEIDAGRDESYLGDLWQPGLRRAGDFRTAMILAMAGDLVLHNTGKYGDELGQIMVGVKPAVGTAFGHVWNSKDVTGIVPWLTRHGD